MTTGASRYPPRPDLRASDAERERVAAFLRDQSLEGRLTTDELDERLGRAYRAVTVRELRELVVDLPGSPLGPPQRGRPAPPALRRSPNLAPPALAACVVLMAPWLLGVAASVVLAMGIAFVAVVFALAFVLAPVMLIALAVLAVARRHLRSSWGRPHPW
jgi:hypothetical protein